MNRRARIAWVLWATGVAMLVAAVARERGGGDSDADLALVGAWIVVVITVGAVVASRTSANPIGWILLGVGWFWVAAGLLGGVLEGAGSPLGDWLEHWAWVPPVLVPLTFLLLLFPDGRLPSRRWRPILWAAAIGVPAFAVATAFGPFYGGSPEYGANPYHVPGLATTAAIASALVPPAVIGSLASLVVRFRRSRAAERQQLKWLAYSATVTVTVAVGISAAGAFGYVLPLDLSNVLLLGASALLPVAIGVAVLRYRLYDIDRLINRTASYALLSGVLAVVYALTVLAASRLLAPLAVGGDLAVAVATLVAAAVVAPARRRIQATVDRRFDRARYDARQVVARFAERLRDQVDLDDVTGATLAAVAGAVAPAGVSLWLRRSL